MPYLSRFRQFLLSTFLQLDRISEAVTPGERISRYIFYAKHTKKGRVSFGAFIPSQKTKNLSVYRTCRCSERRIWLLGELFVEPLRKDKRRILARGDVSSAVIFDQGLSIVACSKPHPRHANVLDWPDDEPQQQMKAVVLAQKSCLFLHPEKRSRAATGGGEDITA